MKLTPTQTEIYSMLIENISKSNLLLLLKGRAGSGKTTILEKLKKKKSHILLYLDNDSINKIAENKNSFSDVKTFILRGGNNKLDWLSWIFLIFSLIPPLLTIFLVSRNYFYLIMHRRSKKGNIEELSNKEKVIKVLGTLDVLVFIHRCFIHIYNAVNQIKCILNCHCEILHAKHCVVIFDETNFYDPNSLELLSILIDHDYLKKKFPRLALITPLVSYSEEYYMPEKLDKIIQTTESKNIFTLGNYNEDDLKVLLWDDDISREQNNFFLRQIQTDLKQIKTISLDSNLALVISILEYIKSNRKLETYNFETNHIESIIAKYLKEDNLKDILSVSTIPLYNVLQKEIISLAQKTAPTNELNYYEIKGLLQRAIATKILKGNTLQAKEYIEFVDPTFKNYFFPKNKEKRLYFFKEYSTIMKSVCPGDYFERAECYRLSGDNEKYSQYLLMHCIQNYIKGIPSKEISLIKDDTYLEYTELMNEAYSAFYKDDFETVLLLTDRMNKLPLKSTLLRFEELYIRSKVKILSSDTQILREIESVMLKKREALVEEREVIIRINLILYVLLLYGQNNQDFRYNKIHDLEQTIINQCESLSKISGRYDYYKFTVYRRAIISSEIESAYNSTKSSLDYFSDLDWENSILYRRERFYSIINHSVTCCLRSRYDEGMIHIKNAIKMYNVYQQEFSNLTLFNNFAILSFYSGEFKMTECIKYLLALVSDIDETETDESTYYIIFNNIACFYAMNDNLDLALENMEKAMCIINRRGKEGIFNHRYVLEVNKSVLLYLNGDRKRATELLTNNINKQTYRYEEKYQIKRYNLLYSIFGSKSKITKVSELDSLMRRKNNSQQNPEMNHYNRSLQLWNMQYWSK